jgi:tripartite-type tricarboxylate transporter receptor subunit TctC
MYAHEERAPCKCAAQAIAAHQAQAKQEERMNHALANWLLLGLCLAIAPCVQAAEAAKDYPNKPIRVVISQSPGSSIDTMGRVLLSKMSELIGQQFIIDNRVGAGGTIGGNIVAHADPDGYTLFAAATASQVIGPQVYLSTRKYDPFKDFLPISQFAVTQNILVVNPKTPFRSVPDIVAYAKANPGKINWSNAGAGFQSHLAGVYFTHKAGIEVLHVPYKGAGPSLAAAVSGESHVTFVPVPSVLGLIRTGQVRGIAVGGSKRSAAAPDLPTVSESGIAGFDLVGWAGLAAPRALPKVIMDKLHATLHHAVNHPETNTALRHVGAEPLAGTPQEFAALIKRDWTSYGDAIRIAGLKPN